jgi:hypothetical protein
LPTTVVSAVAQPASFDTEFFNRAVVITRAPDPALTPAALANVFADSLLSDHYAHNQSRLGLLLHKHIQRQLDFARTPEMTAWFAEHRGLGFHQEIVVAAVAASDFSKFDPPRTAEGIRRLQANGTRLPYGYLPDAAQPLDDLYLHSVAGEHVARSTFLSFAAGLGLEKESLQEFADAIALAVRGHDSYLRGFGDRIVLPGVRKKRDDSSLSYPRSVSPDGFVVQALDRLEAVQRETMQRYVLELLDPKAPDPALAIAKAADLGVIQNLAFCEDCLEGILKDAQAGLSEAQYNAFRTCPALINFERGIEKAKRILEPELHLNPESTRLQIGEQEIHNHSEFVPAFNALWPEDPALQLSLSA